MEVERSCPRTLPLSGSGIVAATEKRTRSHPIETVDEVPAIQAAAATRGL